MNKKTRILIEPGYALVRVFSEPVERGIPLYLRKDHYIYSFGAAFNSFGEIEIQGLADTQSGDTQKNFKTMFGYLREISDEFNNLGYPVVKWRHNNGIIIKDARNPGDKTDDEIIEFLMS